MAESFFISDLHLGHKNILKFSKYYRKSNTIDEHDQWIVNQCNKIVSTKDNLYILGDICFDLKKLSLMEQIKGKKHLILGNHDVFNLDEYKKYFSTINPPLKLYNYWLTHFPIHEQELYGKKNIHGHVHHNYVKNENYINVCVETNHAMPISFDAIHSGRHYRNYTSFIDMIENSKE